MTKPAISRVALSLRHELRYSVANYELSFFLLMRTRPQRQHLVVTNATDLVVEGFPRSGNTFAVAALTLTQPSSFRIAHHLHAPAQILYAIRRGIPALVLVRPPDAAVPSLVLREPYLSLRQALRTYIRFYERLLPYKKDYVVAPFDMVTNDFGAIVSSLNRRWQMNLTNCSHTEDLTQRCFQLIEEWHKANLRTGTVLPTLVARPTSAKETEKERLRVALEGPKLRVLRQKADAICLAMLASP